MFIAYARLIQISDYQIWSFLNINLINYVGSVKQLFKYCLNAFKIVLSTPDY